MKQPQIITIALNHLISRKVSSQKTDIRMSDLDVAAIMGSGNHNLIEDSGAQFRSLSLSEPQLKELFLLTVIQYTAHVIAMCMMQGSFPQFLPNIFQKYEKKNRKLTMYDCIDIMQAHMAQELQLKRPLINPAREGAYM